MYTRTSESNRTGKLALFRGVGRKAALVITAFAISIPTALMIAPASPAEATELSDAQKELRTLTTTVDQAQDAYNAEQDKIDAANAEVARLQGEIDAIEERLAPYRAQLEDIAKWQYVSGNGSFIEMLLDDETSLVDIIEQTQYMDKLTADKAATMAVIAEGEDELYAAQQEQRDAIERAEEAKQASQEIIESSQPAIDELASRIEGLREEQREYLLGKGLAGGGPAYDVPEEGDVVDYALSRVGCPYVWGAAGATSFDCSGLVQWSYAQVGVSLPHNSEALRAAAKQIVPLSEAKPGDVLYRSGHVGICTKAGATEYVHAPNSGCYVRINDNNAYSRFTCALRF